MERFSILPLLSEYTRTRVGGPQTSLTLPISCVTVATAVVAMDVDVIMALVAAASHATLGHVVPMFST